jgi:hypothetical protein
VKVLGPVDHGFVRSIYFFDPNGLRLEIAARTEQAGLSPRSQSGGARDPRGVVAPEGAAP